jgi:hypothetical protein
MLKRVLLTFITLFVLSLGCLSGARAQRIKLSVLPPQVEILMKPNLSLIKAFNFENLQDPGVFYFKVVSFKSSGDQGNIDFFPEAEGPVRFSLENSDLALEKPFFLKSHSTVQAILKIRTIENAPPGDYYYTLLMVSEPSSTQVSAGRGSAILGANILLSITTDGFTPTRVKVAQFQIVPRYKFNFFGKTFLIVEPTDQVPVILKLANTGNYFVTPEAKISLRGPYGVNKSKKLLPQNILRNSERLLLRAELEECSRCQTAVSAVLSGFYFGKYQLTADITFAGLNQKIFAESEFWALPVKLTRVFVGLFFFSAVLLYFLRRKQK